MAKQGARRNLGGQSGNLEDRRSATSFREEHNELYGLLLHANDRIADVGAVLIWVTALLVVGLCVSIHEGWLDAALGVSMAPLRGVHIYVLIALAAFVLFYISVRAMERREYERLKPAILQQLDCDRVSPVALLAIIARDERLKGIYRLLAKDRGIRPRR
jgi:uncharacterized membrane protein (DUF485 family)